MLKKIGSVLCGTDAGMHVDSSSKCLEADQSFTGNMKSLHHILLSILVEVMPKKNWEITWGVVYIKIVKFKEVKGKSSV